MRIVDLAAVPDRVVDRFDSHGFTIGRLVRGDVSLNVARLDTGGMIGRHPAIRLQLLTPISGSVEVTGSPEGWVRLDPGQAAMWEPAEQHATRAMSEAVLMIIESDAEMPPES